MPPIGKPVKVKSYSKTFKNLMHFCKPHTFSLVFVIFLGLLSTLIYTFIPIFMKDLVNCLSPMDKVGIIKYSIISLCLLASGIITDATNGIVFAGVIGKITYQIRKQSVQKINHLPLNYFDTHKIGDILSRLTNDADTFQTSMGNMIWLVTCSLNIIGFLTGMFIIQ